MATEEWRQQWIEVCRHEIGLKLWRWLNVARQEQYQRSQVVSAICSSMLQSRTAAERFLDKVLNRKIPAGKHQQVLRKRT